MLLAPPVPLVEVTPTREVRTVSPVNEVTVDGGRAATLVGTVQSWEYLLVWTPKGIVVRASLACDLQETNVVLAGNRFAHLCYQGGNFVVTGTIRPLRGRIALRAAGDTQVALAGGGSLVAGSAGGTVWRFDLRSKRKLRTYAGPVIVLGVDGGRVLVDRGPGALDVLSRTGAVIGTVKRPHDGGAALRGGRVATIAGRTLTIGDLHGRTLLTRRVAAGARLEDFDGRLAVYSVETRLHLLRLGDGRDVRLGLRGQFGYAHARLSGGALFYAYDQRTGRLGHAAYLDAPHVQALFRG